jgi:hypothetical protein
MSIIENQTLSITDLKEGHNYEYNLGNTEPKYVKCILRRTLTDWLVNVTEGDMKGTKWIINSNTISRLRK